jgi:glycosyltransferase involved in cell wall biosynthesis
MTEPIPVPPHAVSVVIPVYQGASTLPGLIAQLARFADEFCTTDGHRVKVAEVLLVHDNGPDNSAVVIRELAERYWFVRAVWLSRNFGQHPATLAGMASSGGDWIVTMDEDGQHDPAAIGAMLDVAMERQADLVYARPVNRPPHGAVRNVASRMAKQLIAASAGSKAAKDFHSYRLVLGEVGRSVAAYAGAGAYLDVAMSWVARRIETCPVALREEGGRPSGYSFRSLSSHFWRMVISSGTRGLRLVSLLGVLAAIGGFGIAGYLVIARLFSDLHTPQGWPSMMATILVCSGAILFSLGVIAEYIGVNVNMAMGRPLYLIVSDPAAGPLGRHPAAGGKRESDQSRPEPAEEMGRSELTDPGQRPLTGSPQPGSADLDPVVRGSERRQRTGTTSRDAWEPADSRGSRRERVGNLWRAGERIGR